MTTDGEDRSSWARNGQVIRRDELLRLIEENRHAYMLDLRGAVFIGDGPDEGLFMNPIDLSPDTIQREATDYRSLNPGTNPIWLAKEGGIHFSGAQLQGASLKGAHLQGSNLTVAKLEETDLRNAQLQGSNLMLARLQGANFYGAVLQDTNFDLTRLERIHFTAARLQGLDFSHAVSLEGSHWNGAVLDHTRVRHDQLGDAIGDEVTARHERTPGAYQRASDAYLLLKNNFNQIGRYEDASWAYIKEQQMEKMAHYRKWRASLRKNWSSFLRWLRNWSFELLTGYGEMPPRPALWWLGVIAIFTVIYAIAGNIAPDFAGDPATAQGSHNFWDALTHSIAAFATIGFNTLEPVGRTARLLTAIESALGIGFFALFIFTLGNRMSRS